MKQLELIEGKIKYYLFAEDRYRTVLLISIAAYIIFWSILSIGQLLTINEPVFDLALSLQRLWTIFHVPMTLNFIISNIFFDGIVFLFSPISLFNNYAILLVIQTIFLGSASIFLYGISCNYVKNNKISFILAASYLIYFPLAGVNFFSFHFQSFFIFFFIAGYYFYIKQNYKLSLFLFLISGITRYPYMFFPFLFSLVSFGDYFKNRRLTSKEVSFRGNLGFFIPFLLFSFSILFLIIGFFVSSGFSGISADVHASSTGNIVTNLATKIETLILLFLPVLFIPFLSKRWILFYLPFIVLLFFSNNIFYEYPVLFKFQYGTLIIPFIYLGLIDGIFVLVSRKGKNSDKKKLKGFSKQSIKTLSIIILILIIVFALFLEPYGPFNSQSKDNYQLGSNLSFNSTLDSQLTKIIKLIPENDTNVLFQNDLPEILPRPPDNSYGFLIAGYTHFTNISNSMIRNNSFSLHLANGSCVNSKINFVLAYLNSNTLYTGNPSMYTFLTLLYDSGIYGIVAEDMGFVLLERGFHASPIYFVPLMETFHTLEENKGLSYLFPNYNTILNSPQRGVYENKYNPISLAPGIYNITFTISVKNLPAKSMIIYGIVSPIYHNFSYLNVSNKDTIYLKVNIIIKINTFSDFVDFELSQIGGNSALTLEFLNIRQI